MYLPSFVSYNLAAHISQWNKSEFETYIAPQMQKLGLHMHEHREDLLTGIHASSWA